MPIDSGMNQLPEHNRKHNGNHKRALQNRPRPVQFPHHEPKDNSLKYNSESNDMPLKASLSAAFLAILFGANAVAIKISLSGMGSFTNAGLRFTFAAIAITGFARITGVPLAITRKQAGKLLVLSLIFTVQLSCFYAGMAKTTASHGTLIINLLPFVILVLAHFFIPGDSITLKKSAGIGLGFIGIVFLLLDMQAMGGDLKTGDAIVFCAVLLWGCNAVYSKRIIPEFNAIQIVLYPMLFGIPVFLLCGYFWDDPMVTRINPGVVQALCYQSFVSAAFGFIAWNTLIKRYGVTAVHSFVFIMPVSGVFFGVLILGEPMSLHLLVSIVFIVTGILVVNMKRKTKVASVATGVRS